MILKRKHIFLLCLFLFLTSFGCSSSASSGGSENDKVTENSESPTTESTPKEDDKKTEKAVSETIEETELLNKNGIILIAKSLDKNSFWGPVIKVYVENTTDGNLTLSLQNLSVNGIMMSDLSSINVAAGKKANDEITIFSSDLEEAGIDVIADIEFQFHIYDSDSWNDVMKTDVLSLHTSAYEGFTFEVDTSGEVLYDKNGIQIISKGLTEAGFLSGPTLKLLIINNSSKDITVSSDDFSVNGFMIYGGMFSEVLSGKMAFDSIYISSSDLEDNEIEKIEDIEFSFNIYDSHSYATIDKPKAIKLTFGD